MTSVSNSSSNKSARTESTPHAAADRKRQIFLHIPENSRGLRFVKFAEYLGPFLTMVDIARMRRVSNSAKNPRIMACGINAAKSEYMQRKEAFRFFAEMIIQLKEVLGKEALDNVFVTQFSTTPTYRLLLQDPLSIIERQIGMNAAAEEREREILAEEEKRRKERIAAEMKGQREMMPAEEERPCVASDQFCVYPRNLALQLEKISRVASILFKTLEFANKFTEDLREKLVDHFFKYRSSFVVMAEQMNPDIEAIMVSIFRFVLFEQASLGKQIQNGTAVARVQMNALDLLNLRREVDHFGNLGELGQRFIELLHQLRDKMTKELFVEVNCRFFEGIQEGENLFTKRWPLNYRDNTFTRRWLANIIDYYFKKGNLLACFEILKASANKRLSIGCFHHVYKAFASTKDQQLLDKIDNLQWGNFRANRAFKLMLCMQKIDLTPDMTFEAGLKLLTSFNVDDICQNHLFKEYNDLLNAIVKLPCSNLEQQLKLIDALQNPDLINMFNLKLMQLKKEKITSKREINVDRSVYIQEAHKIFLTRTFAVKDVPELLGYVTVAAGNNLLDWVGEFLKNAPDNIKLKTILIIVKQPLDGVNIFKHYLYAFLNIKKTKAMCVELGKAFPNFLVYNHDIFLKWAAENVKEEGLLSLSNEENLWVFEACLREFIEKAKKADKDNEDQRVLRHLEFAANTVLEIFTNAYPSKNSKLNKFILKVFLDTLGSYAKLLDHKDILKIFSGIIKKNSELKLYFELFFMHRFTAERKIAKACDVAKAFMTVNTLLPHGYIRESLVNLFNCSDVEFNKLFVELLKSADKNPEMVDFLHLSRLNAVEDNRHLKKDEKHSRYREYLLEYLNSKDIILGQYMQDSIKDYLGLLAKKSVKQMKEFFGQLLAAAGKREDLQKILHACLPK